MKSEKTKNKGPERERQRKRRQERKTKLIFDDFNGTSSTLGPYILRPLSPP